jgi:hypothetical protein
MTTERCVQPGVAAVSCVLCVVLAWSQASCAGTSSTRHGDRIDVSTYPPQIQAAYRVFAVRCSRCHTLARPLNAQIDDPDHWVRYVTRMRRNPTSGINRKDAEIILQFLLFYTDARVQHRSKP